MKWKEEEGGRKEIMEEEGGRTEIMDKGNNGGRKTSI